MSFYIDDNDVRDRKNIIVELIKSNNIPQFKNYIKENHIEIKNLNNKNYDILINSIEQDVSVDMIDAVIAFGKYKTLNYSIYRSPSYIEKSPLSTALERNNFPIADYLIEYGADLNYIGNDFQDMICTYQTIDYILHKDKGIHVEQIINIIIREHKNIFLKKIAKNYIFDNEFILNFVRRNRQQQQQPLTRAQLEDILQKEKQKIKINESMYLLAINNYNYDAVSILYEMDTREKETILNDFLTIFNQNEFAKLEILKSIKNSELKAQIENQFLKDLENINTDLDHEETINKLIKSNQLSKLKSYIHENHIQLRQYNDKYNGNNDFLKISIENNVSLSMIAYIIEECHYVSFNYDIIMDRKPSTLLYHVLSHHQYKIFDLLIQRGADINRGGDIFTRFYNNKQLNNKILKYLLNSNFRITCTIINKLLLDNQLDLLKNIFRYSIFNDPFILKLISISKNRTALSDQQINDIITQEKKKIILNSSVYSTAFTKEDYKVMEFLYHHDDRKKEIIFMDLFQILYRDEIQNKGTRKKLVLQKIKDKELDIPLDHQFLNTQDHTDEKRATIKEKIKRGNLIELQNYIKSHNILMNYLNNDHFDLLKYAIDKDASIDILKFILSQYQTLNYAFHGNLYGIYESPLFWALSKNKFVIADLLLLHGADINFIIQDDDIISKLYFNHLLNDHNLKYILNNGFSLTTELLITLLSKEGIDFTKDYRDNLLKIIFKHYNIDNSFVLNLLSIYKNKFSLSKKELQKVILNKTDKVIVSYECINEALNKKNDDAIIWFFNNIDSKSDLFLNSDVEILLYKAIEMNSFTFVEKLIKCPLFDINKINIESFFLYISVSAIFELSSDGEGNNLKIVKFFIENLLKNSTFDFSRNSFENLLLSLNEINDIELVNIFIDKSFQHKTFNVKRINFENLFYIINSIGSKDLFKSVIEKLFNHKTFNFSDINFEAILSTLSIKDNNELMKFFIKKSFHHKKFNIKLINIKKDLLIIRQLDDNIPVLKYYIKEILNSNQFSLDNINIDDLLFATEKIDNEEFTKFINKNFIK
ncbi:hypothetical protein U3516DRAFT_854805 [Neocallimastix sp. 'constans']